MTETLYAFLAMALITLLSLNQQRSTLATYQNLIHSEFELMANGVALQEMEILSGKEFDSLLDYNDFVKETTFTAGSVSVPFQVRATVRYTTREGDPSPSPTDYVEMTVSVSHDQYDNPLVTHVRILSS